VVRRCGARKAIFDTPAATPNDEGIFDVVIVDLDTMEITWRGQPAAAPLPRAGRQCMSMAGVRYAAGGHPGERRELRVGLDGEGFAVLGAIECVMTGDGERLLLLGPSSIHLYAVEPSD
jgi:hypothetical protein